MPVSVVHGPHVSLKGNEHHSLVKCKHQREGIRPPCLLCKGKAPEEVKEAGLRKKEYSMIIVVNMQKSHLSTCISEDLKMQYPRNTELRAGHRGARDGDHK